jgi:hypothetical protein
MKIEERKSDNFDNYITKGRQKFIGIIHYVTARSRGARKTTMHFL